MQTVQTIIILIFYLLAVGLEVSSLALDGLVPLGLHLGEQPLGQWVVGLALLLQSIDLLLVFHICQAFLKLVPRSQLLELVRASFSMIFINFILRWAVLAYREGILALGVRSVGLGAVVGATRVRGRAWLDGVGLHAVYLVAQVRAVVLALRSTASWILAGGRVLACDAMMLFANILGHGISDLERIG